MANIKAGDRVKIKDRPDWPMPGGYKLAGVEGRVFDVADVPEGYILIQLDENLTGIDTSIPLGFQIDAIQKI